ncbi:MAG: ABC transporter permease subunit [Clostridiales bacterium]|jgi:putative aldouronate transport system permease protein|nr:ABC transporter permease subunit [Clostridiales bacterium]
MPIETGRKQAWKKIRRHWQLYLLLLPSVAYLVLFRYYPMYGIQIAFKDWNAGLGISGSRWAEPLLKYFISFISSANFTRLLKNTLILSSLTIACSFPMPILLAISLNECRKKWVSRAVQTITYMPYFISTVVLVSMIMQMFSPFGLVNNFLQMLRMEKINILSASSSFRPVYILSGIWQGTGYSAVVYIAALSGISSELYEAATIDGATIAQKVWHIDIPSIMPTAVILLILSSGSVLNVGFEKVFLLQNQLNMNLSDVISTYVYRVGLESAQYSYSAAIGLFNSVISTLILICVNSVAKKLSETSLW